MEEREGRLYGYEFKYRANRAKPPKGWLETYDNAEFDLIHKGNYLQFIASP